MQTLTKGENLFLTQAGRMPEPLTVQIQWANPVADSSVLEVDASAFVLSPSNKVRSDADFIFYNQPHTENRALELRQSEGVQTFSVRLSALEPSVHKIAFVLTLHEARQRQQSFGMLGAITFSVAANATELARFTLQDASTETALILAECYRYQDQWKLKAVGQGYMDGLECLARNFGVQLDANAEADVLIDNPDTLLEPPPKPMIIKYIEAIAPKVLQFQQKAQKARQDGLNESGTRLLIDSVLQNILFYPLQDIKTEQKIPNKQGRVDYLLSVGPKKVMVIEAKHINQRLDINHISQATAYAYHSKIDFALLTNGIEWRVYYVKPKRLKKYDYHLVLSVNLLQFNQQAAERLFLLSKVGVVKENTLEMLKLKTNALNDIDEMVLANDVVERISELINNKHPGSQVTAEDVRHAIQNNLLK